MSNIRSWYLFLVSAISLQSVIWATIRLLRGVLHPDLLSDFNSITVEIAVIIIGLPVFFWHWTRTRDSDRDLELDTDFDVDPSAMYFYSMLLGFFYPIVSNSIILLAAIFQLFLGFDSKLLQNNMNVSEAIISSGVALFILSSMVFYFYKQRFNLKKLDIDSRTSFINLRRIFLFVLSLSGLLVTVYSVLSLSNWILLELFYENTVTGLSSAASIILDDASRLLIGLVLWQLPWSRLQLFYERAYDGEQESPVRKIYLYSLIFVSSLVFITIAATLFSSILSKWLGVQNDGEFYIAINVLSVFGVIWLYHAMVLHNDAKSSVNKYVEAKIVRIYRYLLSVIGLVVLLVGLGGALDVIIRMIWLEELGNALRSQIANVLSALFASAPLWLLSWTKIQKESRVNNEMAQVERQSVVRKAYLYFFLYISTMTVLINGVIVLSGFLNIWMGDGSIEDLFDDFPYAIAYSFIALIVWLYHRAVLNEDKKSNSIAYTDSNLTQMRVVVFMPENSSFAVDLSSKLEFEFPTIEIEHTYDPKLLDNLTEVDVIIINTIDSNIVSKSSARKFVIMSSNSEQWYWIGMPHQSQSSQIRNCIHTLRQVLSGEEVKTPHKFNGCIVGVVIFIGIFLLFLFTMIFLVN